MDQKRIGSFLRELRKEKGLTQEQLAETLGVSNRSVSRWENGVNLPDFDLVIEIARYFSVSIEEFLDGEKKQEMLDQKTEQTLLKVADYESNGKKQFSGRICILFLLAIAAFGVHSVLNLLGLSSQAGYVGIANFSMGLVFGALLVGALYTSRYMARVQVAKQRLLCRLKGMDRGSGAASYEKN